MKRFIPIFVMILAWATAACATPPTPLTTLHAIAALSNEQARLLPPVAFPATVTYYNAKTNNLNVQENNEAIFVSARTPVKLVPGDRVLVRGTLQPSFLPYVISNDIALLHHGTPPKPIPASYDDLVHKKINCMLVTVHGVIRTADLLSSPVAPSGFLQLLMEGGYIDIEVENNDASALRNLLDAEVEITGAAGRRFDGKMQQTGAKVKVFSFADIKVIKRATSSPWSLPITPSNDIVMGTHVRDLTQRLRVHGTITWYQPGTAVVLQNGAVSLWVSTQTSEPFQIGDIADATGFPDTHNGKLTLAYAEVQDSQLQAPVLPQPATWRQLAFWGRSQLGGHQYDLVSIEGKVTTELREAMQDEYILIADGHEFTAIYRHPPPPRQLPRMLEVPLGSTIRVTGICLPMDTNPFNDEEPFDILMRSFDDVQVVAPPTLLTVSNMMIVAGLLLGLVVLAGVRGWTLERKVRRQTASIAYLERRRRRILEDINGTRPLAEVIEQITEIVSFRLHGAPCWCEVADGARLGNWPSDLARMRVLQSQIFGRFGGDLGTIYAAFDQRTRSSSEESESVAMGAGLSALAIETRRLYHDLLHRSEFDLLTDIQNRFSMEKQLDAQIGEARQMASTFGLIYIDLDDFKLVNDRCGHHVGDLYLQEATSRMKNQLRPTDILARLGGDEFAVLVPLVRTRTEVDEIALRLKRSFEEPFAIEGHILHGSASIGAALYPDDANTRDTLLRAADAAMYKAKHAMKAQGVMQTLLPHVEFMPKPRK